MILIRHGRAPGNAENRLMGREDLALDEVGRSQATGLADGLSAREIDEIWSSPLARAVQTAAPIAGGRGLGVSLSDDLLEFDFGEASGSGTRPKVKRDHLYVPVPGGESLFDAWQRAGAFLAAITPALGSGATVVVVGHYRSGQLLAGRFLGCSFEDAVRHPVVRLENAEAVELQIGAEPVALWRPPG